MILYFIAIIPVVCFHTPHSSPQSKLNYLATVQVSPRQVGIKMTQRSLIAALQPGTKKISKKYFSQFVQFMRSRETKAGEQSFLFCAAGELYKNIDDAKAKENLQKAYSVAKTQTEKQAIQDKINQLMPC